MEPQQPITQSQTKARSHKKPMIILAALIIVVVAAVIAVVITGGKSSTSKTQQTKDAAALVAGKVDITAAGFVPASIQVKVGDTVTWTNSDSALHQVATGPFPSEDGLAGFVAKTPQMKGDSYRYTFEKAGTYAYHDHLNPLKLNGTVVVVQ